MNYFIIGAFSAFIAFLLGILCTVLIHYKFVDDQKHLGTLYISFEEGDVPIYFASDFELEELLTHRIGWINVIRKKN